MKKSMSGFKLRVQKGLAEMVLNDFEAWCKANTVSVGPPISEKIKRYLAEVYDEHGKIDFNPNLEGTNKEVKE